MSRPPLVSRIRNRLREHLRRRRFAASVEHLHGPRKLDVAPGEVVLIALVKDGGYYLDAFFDYYRGLGIRHFVFFDNGSTDDSIARIRAEPGTVIDRSPLPLAGYEDLIRQYPATTYGAGRWCLYVDMDEVFDFEGRETIGLAGLLRYLEREGATGFAAQMLEMFPRAPLSAVAEMPFAEALQAFAHYDISFLRRFGYHSPEIPFSALLEGNSLTGPGPDFLFGGVRGKVFGENCCLTKHPLIFNGPGVTPAPHPHLSMGLRVADVTGVIKHYKFTNNPVARDRASRATGSVAHGEDAARVDVLNRQPDVTLWSDAAQTWEGIAPLYEAGFLMRSDRYSDFVAGQGA